jgi:hypothetical protein
MSVLGLRDELSVDAAKGEYVLVLELTPDECFTGESLMDVLQSIKSTFVPEIAKLCE